jgi:hypothetical protein
MAQTAPEPTPIDPYELAAGFRRLAALTNDPELAERMMRHADETEHEAAKASKKHARH